MTDLNSKIGKGRVKDKKETIEQLFRSEHGGHQGILLEMWDSERDRLYPSKQEIQLQLHRNESISE